MSCPQVIRVVTAGPPGPSLVLTAPALAGRGAGVGELQSIGLGSGLSIVDGVLVLSGAAGTGTVTSVGLSAPTGFSVTGSPVTGTGTLGLTFATGYSLPTNLKQGEWDAGAALAGTAVQPGDLATVATSGAYNDLSGRPDLALKADLVNGLVPTSQIPALAVTEFLGTVANQSALLALTGQRGDWAIRSDTGTTWVLTTDGGNLLAHWTQLSYPAAPVASVNGQTGTVMLGADDVGAATAAQGALADTAVQPAQLPGVVSTSANGLARALGFGTIAHTAQGDTVVLNFATLNGQVNTINLLSDLDLIGMGYANGQRVELRLIAGASNRTLTFPVEWRPMGANPPATLPANKWAKVSIECYGSTINDVLYGIAVQP